MGFTVPNFFLFNEILKIKVLLAQKLSENYIFTNQNKAPERTWKCVEKEKNMQQCDREKLSLGWISSLNPLSKSFENISPE